MNNNVQGTRCAVLVSGGLDSCILVGHLLDGGCQVQPIYVRSGLIWEEAELTALRSFLESFESRSLSKLVTLDVPVGDLYAPDHWSLVGENTPNAESPDGDVFLPGRNALLIVKAALWCQLHGCDRLALAPLRTSPFADATAGFFRDLQAALNCGDSPPIQIEAPFSRLSKSEVMRLGRGLPLELSFSCIAPLGDRHCGRCNKCAERRSAFLAIDHPDPTQYARSAL